MFIHFNCWIHLIGQLPATLTILLPGVLMIYEDPVGQAGRVGREPYFEQSSRFQPVRAGEWAYF